MSKWCEDDIKYLIDEYSNKSNKELSKNLNRTECSILNMARIYKLKKSKSHMKKMKSKRNKMVGRDMCFDNVKKISSKFKSRGEFQLRDPSAYVIARRKGWLDEVCEHMLPQNFSIPQMILKSLVECLFNEKSNYNDRQILYPYEIDVYFPTLKLGFEYNGRGWHIDNENDKIKKELCEECGITLITIEENHRRYEEDIKNQLKNHFPDKNIDEIEINYDDLFSHILDEKKIIDTISKYTNYTSFRKNETKLYNKLRKLNLLGKYTRGLKRTRERWTEDKIINEVSKYKYLSEFIEKSYGCYLFVQKNKRYQYLLNGLINKKTGKVISY